MDTTSTSKLDMNSEPKNITRVRSRSSRIPVDLHQAFTFGDGGLSRRPANNVLNSPNETFAQEQQHLQQQLTSHSQQQQQQQRYYWGHSDDDPGVAHVDGGGPMVVFPIKVGRSPINHNNNNNNNNNDYSNSNAVAFSGQRSTSPTESISPPLSAVTSAAAAAHPQFSSGHHQQSLMLGVNSSSENNCYNSSNSPNSSSAAAAYHSKSLAISNLYDRVMKDTVEILESPTTTDPDLYLRNNSIGEIPSPVSSTETNNNSHSGGGNCPGGGGGVRMIGGVQIADYEGSPRRFGHPLSGGGGFTSNLHLPDTPIRAEVGKSPSPLGARHRPGFPQRVILSTTPSALEQQTEKRDKGKEKNEEEDDEEGELELDPRREVKAFDYVYEFSETRKVLNEFFDKSGTDLQSQKNQKKRIDSNKERSGGGGGGVGGWLENRDQQLNDMTMRTTSTIADGSASNWSGINERGERGSLAMGGGMMMMSPERGLVDDDDDRRHHHYHHHHQHPHLHHHHQQQQNAQKYYQESSQDLMFLDVISQDGSVAGGGGGCGAEMEAHIMRNSKNFTLSPETTDYDSNCGDLDSFSNDLSTGGGGGGTTDYGRLYTAMPVLEDGLSSGHASDAESHHNQQQMAQTEGGKEQNLEHELEKEFQSVAVIEKVGDEDHLYLEKEMNEKQEEENVGDNKGNSSEPKEESHQQASQNVNDALKEIQTAIQRVKVLSAANGGGVGDGGGAGELSPPRSPIWVPRLRASQESLNSDFNPKDIVGIVGGSGGLGGGGGGGEDDELDTDLETDRLLGQQRLEDHFYQEDNNWVLRNKLNLKGSAASSSAIRHDTGSTLLPSSPTESRAGDSENGNSPQRGKESPTGSVKAKQDAQNKNKARNKEGLSDPSVLIEGVLFRAKYLGSTQLVCEGQPTKTTRMMQAEEAVSRIKAPEGESQPSTEVDLFISTEKIMVLNTDLKEIMMDHALRTISYIADIGELVVLMARRRLVPQDVDDAPKQNRTPKMICHVFESDEAQFIAQSIGQAFQVAYVEFLKANGIEDHSFVKEMDYQEVLNSQEIFGDELEVFAKKELQKEVVVPKAKGEILGVVIVESGWGSMLPTVVIANLLSNGAAARCGHLNIGDQIIAINGLSLVGLPLSTCQTYIKNTKNQTAVKFTVVPCAPVVEVKIKRPNTKYQLGFSVQNGVICSLLRGGIAERGGVRVGHRIIEINNQSVVAVPHEKIVTLLATSVGEILMKTMPTSMFRLLTGQENPLYI